MTARLGSGVRIAAGVLAGIVVACVAVAPPSADYVNRGSDERILEGVPVVGPVSKRLQYVLSFRSTTPPRALEVPLARGGHVAVCWPAFLTVAKAKSNGRYWTFRIGWRWDRNWPGYIADVIVKTDMRTPVPPRG